MKILRKNFSIKKRMVVKESRENEEKQEQDNNKSITFPTNLRAASRGLKN